MRRRKGGIAHQNRLVKPPSASASLDFIFFKIDNVSVVLLLDRIRECFVVSYGNALLLVTGSRVTESEKSTEAKRRFTFFFNNDLRIISLQSNLCLL